MGPCLGPYAWVQGRCATSKVTATSPGRLTKHYAWVIGRLAHRSHLGVNLPLRVPPCKHYREEVAKPFFMHTGPGLLFYCPRRGVPGTHKLETPSAENPELSRRVSVKPGVVMT